MDKSVEKTVTLFRKSYAGRLTADERAEIARLLEDESMRRLYEEVGDDEYLIGEFRQYVGWEPVRGYRKFRKNMRRQSIRRNLIRLSVAASLLMALGVVWLLVKQDRPEVSVKMAETVVEPGPCRAFLQLSSGERIVKRMISMHLMRESGGAGLRKERAPRLRGRRKSNGRRGGQNAQKSRREAALPSCVDT